MRQAGGLCPLPAHPRAPPQMHPQGELGPGSVLGGPGQGLWTASQPRTQLSQQTLLPGICCEAQGHVWPPSWPHGHLLLGHPGHRCSGLIHSVPACPTGSPPPSTVLARTDAPNPYCHRRPPSGSSTRHTQLLVSKQLLNEHASRRSRDRSGRSPCSASPGKRSQGGPLRELLHYLHGLEGKGESTGCRA